MDIDLTRILDGFQNRLLRDLVERDTFYLVIGQVQRFLQMPADGFPLSVFVGREPHHARFVRFALQLPQSFFLVVGNDVRWFEVMVHIHA